MEWQLRMYRAKEGALDAFADEWHEHVLPLRRSRGFEVLGPWIAEDGQFVWLIGADDLEAADAAYYACAERKAISPDPARHIESATHIRLEER